jgi:hypothetical protein
MPQMTKSKQSVSEKCVYERFLRQAMCALTLYAQQTWWKETEKHDCFYMLYQRENAVNAIW